jgi:flagellar assembly protein FliH
MDSPESTTMQPFIVQLPRKIRNVEIEYPRVREEIHEPVFEEFSAADFEEFEEIDELTDEQSILLAEAQEQVQAAYDRGFNDGKQVATGTMMVEIQKQREILKNFDGQVDQLQSKFGNLMAQAEESIIELALALAENIVAEKIKSDKSVVVAQARKSLAQLHGADAVVLRLNPADVDALELAQSTLIADPMSMPKIKLESDHTVEEGGCIMESSLGTVDAQLRTQFAKMAEKLRTAQKTV